MRRLLVADRVACLGQKGCRDDAAVLTGRFLDVYDDIQELVKQTEAIQRQDLYTLRLRR